MIFVKPMESNLNVQLITTTVPDHKVRALLGSRNDIRIFVLALAPLKREGRTAPFDPLADASSSLLLFLSR